MTLTPEKILNNNIELVSLPDIVFQLNNMVNDPMCNAAEIGALIAKDAALSMRLLKIVNSPFYGFPSSIDSIPMAITVLGVRQLRDLVFTSCVIKKYSKIPSNVLNADTFWHHSIATALCAQILAKQVKLSHSDRLFTCGMLHDIGLLILALTAPDEIRQVLELSRDSNKPCLDFQFNVFGFSQADVGAALIRKWHLPESLIEPVQLQQTNKAATRFPMETAILKIANVIANNNPDTAIFGDNQIIHPGTLELLGLTEADLGATQNQLQASLQTTLNIIYVEQAA